MRWAPKNDLSYSKKRLETILSRRRLLFNPYAVSDKRLIELLPTVGWGNEFDLTQLVILKFTRLRMEPKGRFPGGIFMDVGNLYADVFVPAGVIKSGVTANDSLHKERSMLGRRKLRSDSDLETLVGETVFVSHTIRGVWNCNGKIAYRMHRLRGNLEKDARIIRETICSAKIEMLERLLAYPECPDYLDCSRNLFDYETPVLRAMEVIRKYPDGELPCEDI